MFTKPKNLGFSLIELMVVVSITNAIVALSFPTHRKFKYAALQQEAKYSLNVAFAAVKSWTDENDGFPTIYTGFCASTTLNPGAYHCNMVTQFRDPSCNRPNPFGYYQTDCRKGNYEVGVVQNPSYANAWRLDVGLKPNSMGNNVRRADAWNMNSCQATCHSIRVHDLLTLASTWILPTECPWCIGGDCHTFYVCGQGW